MTSLKNVLPTTYILDTAKEPITEDYIKNLHRLLKSGISSEHSSIAPIGRYKVLQNEVGLIATVSVDRVEEEIQSLLIGYSLKKKKIWNILRTSMAGLNRYIRSQMVMVEWDACYCIKNA